MKMMFNFFHSIFSAIGTGLISISLLFTGGSKIINPPVMATSTTPTEIIATSTAISSSPSIGTGWNTYKNTTYGYQISYPADAKFSNLDTVPVAQSRCISINEGLGTIYISTYSLCSATADPSILALASTTQISTSITIDAKQYPLTDIINTKIHRQEIQFSLADGVYVTYTSGANSSDEQFQKTIDSLTNILNTIVTQ